MKLNGGQTMQLEKLFELQQVLDDRIAKEHGLEGERLINKRVLAFWVELGELANEVRCFKFWSNKPASEKKVILEEFVDGMHFLLSIGLELGYRPTDVKIACRYKDNMTSQFNYVLFLLMSNEITLSIYCMVFSQYLGLGELLGFTETEIIEGYYGKTK